MRQRIETERLLLRLPRPEDAETWTRAIEDPEVMRFIGGGRTGDALVALQSVERFIDRWQANGFGQYAVERREDGAFLGRVGLLVWDSTDWHPSTLPEAGDAAEIELGWTLLREHWGHGYAVEAAAAVRDAAFAELRPPRLVSLIHPDNVRSIRVAERLGARPVEVVETAEWERGVIWLHPEPAA